MEMTVGIQRVAITVPLSMQKEVASQSTEAGGPGEVEVIHKAQGRLEEDGQAEEKEDPGQFRAEEGSSSLEVGNSRKSRRILGQQPVNDGL